MPPLVMSQAGDSLRRKVAGLYWAGTELAMTWSGYMSGAVESGERASQEVLQALDATHLKRGSAFKEQNSCSTGLVG